LLDPTKEAHEDALSLLEADMPRLRVAVPFFCLDDLLLLICLIVSCYSIGDKEFDHVVYHLPSPEAIKDWKFDNLFKATIHLM